MLVASVLSLKGGVGKTTVALGLASAAVHRGVTTVLIDLDPQANATSTLEPAPDAAVPPRTDSVTVANVLTDPRRKVVRAALRDTAWGGQLRLLAGSEDAAALDRPDPGGKRLARLATAVRTLPDGPRGPDLVLIDCPPSLGQLTRSALVASQRAILVAEPSLYAVTGVQSALAAVQVERTLHPGLQPLGVVINRVRPRSPEHQFRLAELQDLFGPLILQPQLPERSAVQQAQGAGIAIHSWPTAAAMEVAGMFDALLDRLLRAGRPRAGGGSRGPS